MTDEQRAARTAILIALSAQIPAAKTASQLGEILEAAEAALLEPHERAKPSPLDPNPRPRPPELQALRALLRSRVETLQPKAAGEVKDLEAFCQELTAFPRRGW